MIKKLIVLYLCCLVSACSDEGQNKSYYKSNIYTNKTHKKLQNYPVDYGLDIQISNQPCIIYVNDLPVYSVFDRTSEAAKKTQTKLSIGKELTNGINTIRIRVIDDRPNGEEGLQRCIASLSYDRKGEVIQKIFSLHAEVLPNSFAPSRKGFSAEKSTYLMDINKLNELEFEPKFTETILSESLNINNPKAQDRLYTQQVIVDGLPTHYWEMGESIDKNSSEHREQLIAAYEEIRELIEYHDVNQLSKALEMAVAEGVHALKEDPRFYFHLRYPIGDQLITSDKCIALPINYDDYNFITYNNNRLARLVHKKTLTPPIYYQCSVYGETIGGRYWLQPFFSLVDGEFVISYSQ